MRKLVLFFMLLSLSCALAFSQVIMQQPGGNGRQLPPGENVTGKVTAVAADSVTIAPTAGGSPVTIKVTENTRIFKERQPAKLSDIKVDETVFARGTLKDNVMDAAILGVVNPEMIQRLQQGLMGGGQFKQEDLGKKFIIGEVKAINETKLTIARPDNQTQDIEVDENTSFKQGKESITLADIKVGDVVRGTGELKNGVFVPKELIVGRPRMMMRTEGGAGEQKKPEGEKPK
jgi:uncharacterized protein DUF5666